MEIEKSDDYKVYMYEWHSPLNGKCRVCLAGSVLANTCKFPKDSELDWGGSPKDTTNKLDALEELRIGDPRVAYHALYGSWPEDELYKKLIKRSKEHPICQYEDDPRKFKFQLRFLAKFLKKLGI